MAMASSNSPRTTNPPRDTRTQLFVGNLPYRVRWQDLKDLFRRAGTVLRADVSLGPDNRSRGYGTVLLATAEDAGRAVDMFNGYTWQTRTLEVRPDRMGEELGMAAAAAAAPFAGVGVGMGVGGLSANLGVGVFGTPLLGNLSPAAASLSGAGTPAVAVAGGSGLASPAPSLARFAGLSPFGAGSTLGDDDGPGSRPGTTGGQTSRNLFVGNLPFHIQWQDLKDLFRQAGAVQRADVALGADGRSRGFGTVSFSNEADAERAVRMFNGYEYNGRPLKVHFDKFAAPSSSSAPLVGPGASSTPHSPATFAFSPSPFGSPYGHQQQQQQQQPPTVGRTSSLAQQLLQQQLAHGGGGSPASLLTSRRPSGPYGYPSGGYDDSADVDSLSQQLAQKLALASSSTVPQSPTSALSQQQQAAQQQQQQYARQQSQAPTHIPIPSAPQSPYTFDFLHSGPTTPYDVYDLGTYQRMSMSTGDQAYYQQQYQQAQQQQQDQYNAAFAASVEAASSQQRQDSAQAQTQAQSAMASESASSSTSPPSLAASGTPTQPGQSTSPTSSRSHATPQQHPAHPGPIAIPPPPPVTAFPVPPPHTLSPQYASPHMQGHPMSPMHHPLMGMSMPMMTPHGLPPITPSMPSFTFLPQPSPGLPSPAAVESNEQRQAQHVHAQAQAMMHMQHVMTPFSPFSPGVTMSPGAFWGRPGSGANPFINAAVGAPVRPGQTYYTAYPQQMQQQPQQQQQPEPDQQSQSQAGEQEGRPPDGYFPPVAVSVAMAQGGAVAREEPAGYFPWVPPSNAAEAHQQQQQQQRELRTSGLAYEILRDDSASANAAVAHRETKDSPGASDTTAGTGTTAGAESSRGTSWHTDSEGAVDDADAADAASPSPLTNGNGHDGHHGNGKPRAYSAAASAGAGSERGLQRADSDPIRKALAEQGAL
ncbi:hypothetical protein TRAPUB_893 [Trametes pubescens]|uniref:RRM domain-containing protein n=1 Tax=Trametes pubescens TaxID=154538 RepID=A0A1M2VKS1_TRAPU|nr:hypothetical protein TRAPUB_893 [Trametes pubescens]